MTARKHPQDERLGRLFRALHEEDTTPPLPDWSRLSQPATPVPRGLFWLPVALATALACALWLRPAGPPASPADPMQLARDFAAWSAATDFLLETPGSPYLHSVPAIHSELPRLPDTL